GDECYAPQDRRAEGQIKRVITESTLFIEPKGRGKFRVPNLLHVMLASNHDWVVPAGPHERRYMVEKVAETHRQDAKWFDPIYAQMRNGGYERCCSICCITISVTGIRGKLCARPRWPSSRKRAYRRATRGGSNSCRPASLPGPTISTRIARSRTATKSRSSSATAAAAPTAARASARAPSGATGSTIRPAASRPSSKGQPTPR